MRVIEALARLLLPCSRIGRGPALVEPAYPHIARRTGQAPCTRIKQYRAVGDHAGAGFALGGTQLQRQSLQLVGLAGQTRPGEIFQGAATVLAAHAQAVALGIVIASGVAYRCNQLASELRRRRKGGIACRRGLRRQLRTTCPHACARQHDEQHRNQSSPAAADPQPRWLIHRHDLLRPKGIHGAKPPDWGVRPVTLAT